MGVTQVQARVFGETETCEYTFLVDTGATYMALPLEEIEGLGLQKGRGKITLMSATGLVEVPMYIAAGELMGREFNAFVVPALTPLIGYELLQNLRFRVNPVSERIERVPDDEFHPPFLL